MNGLLLLDKPPGWTSHDAVAFVRSRLGVRTGHAGTLDPMATGLLILLIGEATRLSAQMSGMDKDYRGWMELGIETDTQDLEGAVTRTAPCASIRREALERAFAAVAARTVQTPPAFSAIKRGGKPMYKIARQAAPDSARHGRARAVQDLEPRPAKVYECRLESFESPEAEFFLSVAKGFYVRTFCHDVGELLGCGAAMTCLVRTRIGPYLLSDALRPENWPSSHENLQRFFRPAA